MSDDSTEGRSKEARLREFWNHDAWGDVWESFAERRYLLLLALNGIFKDRAMLVELLHALPHAATKPDPDVTEYADTRLLVDIFEVIKGSYTLDEAGEISIDFTALDALHEQARKVLRKPASAGIAEASARVGSGMWTKAGWGNALVSCLEQAAATKVFGGPKLSRAIRQRTLWQACPFGRTEVAVVDNTGRPVLNEKGDELKASVDLTCLDWDRVPEEKARTNGYQRPGARLLDRWCDSDPLGSSAEAVDFRAKALELLVALGVDKKEARNCLYAADDMKAKRSVG